MKYMKNLMLMMLAVFVTTDGYAATDDEILKKLTAIEGRLSKIEKVIEAGKAAEQLEALRNMFKGNVAARKKEKGAKEEKAGEYLLVTKWSAGDGGEDIIGQRVVEIYYTAKNIAKKTISIVDGSAVFKDKLGETIARLEIERDVELAPGQEKTLGGRYTQSYGSGMERLIVIDKQHVDVSVDLKKLMFSDGDVLKF